MINLSIRFLGYIPAQSKKLSGIFFLYDKYSCMSSLQLRIDRYHAHFTSMGYMYTDIHLYTASCGESPSGCPACPRKAELCPLNPADRTWVEVPVDSGA